jgi:hypothetical protein
MLAVNALFVFWIFGGVGSASNNCDGEIGDSLTACQAGTAICAGIGVFMILVLWVIVDFILLVIWLITRKKTRSCPVCGKNVKQGKTVCKSCGHDFAQSAASVPSI